MTEESAGVTVLCLSGSAGSGRLHNPEKEVIGENGYPKNTVSADMYFCCDSRKDICPYSLHITAETENVSFAGTFCLYGKKKSASVPERKNHSTV
jgi:hypothetical protein